MALPPRRRVEGRGRRNVLPLQHLFGKVARLSVSPPPKPHERDLPPPHLSSLAVNPTHLCRQQAEPPSISALGRWRRGGHHSRQCCGSTLSGQTSTAPWVLRHENSREVRNTGMIGAGPRLSVEDTHICGGRWLEMFPVCFDGSRHASLATSHRERRVRGQARPFQQNRVRCHAAHASSRCRDIVIRMRVRYDT